MDDGLMEVTFDSVGGHEHVTNMVLKQSLSEVQFCPDIGGGIFMFECPACKTSYTTALSPKQAACGVMTCNCTNEGKGEGTLFKTKRVAEYYAKEEEKEMLRSGI